MTNLYPPFDWMALPEPMAVERPRLQRDVAAAVAVATAELTQLRHALAALPTLQRRAQQLQQFIALGRVVLATWPEASAPAVDTPSCSRPRFLSPENRSHFSLDMHEKRFTLTFTSV